MAPSANHISSDEIKDIAKAADYIEALQWAEKFCIDSRKDEIMEDIKKNLDKFLKQCSNIHVADAMGKINW